MAPRKPTWDWKERNCVELKQFTVPFAIKEYVQNVVGQALKDLRAREWSNWAREDLRTLEPKDQAKRKQSLISEYQGLLTGPDGALLKRTKAWTPWYIVSATIPQSQLAAVSTTTDLKIALVLWRHTTLGITALSVYNNHLDKNATFSSFAVDGASTSRDDSWAVGEKGKGFILATQFLFGHVEKTVSENRTKDSEAWNGVKGSVSFRVGHQIGTLKWKKSRYNVEDDVLRVTLDDLSPLSMEQYRRNAVTDARDRKRDDDGDDDGDEDIDAHGFTTDTAENPELRKQAESALKGVYQRRVTQQLDAKGVGDARGDCLVASDEVAVTVIGLDGSFQPEYLFSAIYGIIPPLRQWRVPGSQVQFFIAAVDETNHHSERPNAKFYYRDQYVPYGPYLNRVSVNYHGDLNITSDRAAILPDHLTTEYRLALSTSVDEAFRTIPDLALELALDILTEQHPDGFADMVRPRDKDGAHAYREAFEDAMRKLHPDISAGASIYPTAGPVADRLYAELGLTPVPVSSKAWEIIEASGAYVPLGDYARVLLLASPPVGDSKALERLRVAMAVVAPDVPASNVTIRNYRKATPTVVWDKDRNLFAFAHPPDCEDHPQSECLCWVGPFLHDAATDFDGVQLSTKKLFSAYLLCMKGDANMEDEAYEKEMGSLHDVVENKPNILDMDGLHDLTPEQRSSVARGYTAPDCDWSKPSTARCEGPSAASESTTLVAPASVEPSTHHAPRAPRAPPEPSHPMPVANLRLNPNLPPNGPPRSVPPVPPAHIAAPSNASPAVSAASTATENPLMAAAIKLYIEIQKECAKEANLWNENRALKRRIEELEGACEQKDTEILGMHEELKEKDAGSKELFKPKRLRLDAS